MVLVINDVIPFSMRYEYKCGAWMLFICDATRVERTELCLKAGQTAEDQSVRDRIQSHWTKYEGDKSAGCSPLECLTKDEDVEPHQKSRP